MDGIVRAIDATAINFRVLIEVRRVLILANIPPGGRYELALEIALRGEEKRKSEGDKASRE